MPRPGRKRAEPGSEPAPRRRADATAAREVQGDDLVTAGGLEWADDEPEADAEGEETGSEDEFPELDTQEPESEAASSQDDDDDDDDEGAEEEDDDEEAEEEEDDDEDASSTASETGFNSSDIDQWDEEDEAKYGDAALDRMVSRARVKPDEGERRTNQLGIDEAVAARLYGAERNDDGSQRGRVVKSAATGELRTVYPPIEPEYDSDSSTEDVPNRIGNVPLSWYEDLPHIGYDINGRRVLRPAKGDELDKFLQSVDDGDAWFSARDERSGADVKLTDEELDIIRRLEKAEMPDDVHEPASDWFTQHVRAMPLTGRPEPKSRFVPSKWEHKKVMKIVRAIRQGRIVPHAPGKEKPAFYALWSDADEARREHAMHMPAPKLPLPAHEASYNPPAEYLFGDDERRAWEEADPEDRKLPFMPAKYASLRHVPGYEHAVHERFQRCLDLYLAPRMRRHRLDVDDADALLPKLPSPRELRPFPTHTDVVYAHEARVRAVSVDPTGSWALTGADDGCVRLWDLALGRCAAAWDVNAGVAQSDRSPVYSVQWCPNKALAVAAAASAGRITLLAPPQCGRAVHAASVAHLVPPHAAPQDPVQGAVQWTRLGSAERQGGVCVRIELKSARHAALVPKHVRWHARGDYFASVCPDAASDAVLIHQVSKQRSQAPFRRTRKAGTSAMAVQCVCFHPSRPWLLVATQRYVRIYDLVAQTLVKTLLPGVRWISSIDVHPGGNHVILGSYDRRVQWFDLEMGERPYKTLRYHTKAVRAVAFHPKYPLFASASDDGTVHVYHATVYADLLQPPLLVPLKILRGHGVQDALGVLGLAWHPALPWVVSAAARDGARLWTP